MKRYKYSTDKKPIINADKNEYCPRAAEIVNIRSLNPEVKHFTLKLKDGLPFDYKPGQFVQVSLFGAGESPISITSSQEIGQPLELAIRAVGKVTNEIHKLKVGDELHVRGPYGNFFPYKEHVGKDILFVAGGIGLIPLRPLVNNVIHGRKNYGKIWFLYGAKCPDDCVYSEEIEKWGKEVSVLQTVDSPGEGWRGNVGVVTTLFNQISFSPKKTIAYLCGPPVMIKFTNLTLEEMGMDPTDMITTMEMHMKCGVGKCGHCIIGHKYCCTDGPVFTYAELKALNAEG